jgi:hypothetical protein
VSGDEAADEEAEKGVTSGAWSQVGSMAPTEPPTSMIASTEPFHVFEPLSCWKIDTS